MRRERFRLNLVSPRLAAGFDHVAGQPRRGCIDAAGRVAWMVLAGGLA